MKGLLRGVVAVGLLTGGVLGTGCRTEERPEGDVFRTPLQDKYQPPTAREAEPMGDERKVHPATEQGLGGSGHAGGGTAAPGQLTRTDPSNVPAATTTTPSSSVVQRPREGLGLGLDESYKAAPAQGGSGQMDTQPQPRRPLQQQLEGTQEGGQSAQQAPTTEGH